ncbi:MAG: hypothetical protein OEO77_11430 [Acidimicrobiia bacterium]|nr:hypothetical protein [Acidimicrobiia bacterium]
MRPTVQWIAVFVGAAAGFLSAAFIATAVWAALSSLTAIDDPVTAAVIAGVLPGLAVAGYVTGRMTWRAVFHGGLVGVLAATAVTLMSLAAGSPAPPLVIIAFFGMAMVLGGAGGFVADRLKVRKRERKLAESQTIYPG